MNRLLVCIIVILSIVYFTHIIYHEHMSTHSVQSFEETQIQCAKLGSKARGYSYCACFFDASCLKK